jgi:3-hydroxybutyrate dehydrogenase
MTSRSGLSGRTALVTGAASGIGAACARRLAAEGAHVLAVDISEDGLKTLCDDVNGDAGSGEGTAGHTGPGRIEPVTCDLSDLDGVDALPAEVDVLVNNAGVQHVAPVQEFPPERFAFILRLMLESPFRLTRHVLPHMYAQNWGRVVNISSAHGLRASAFKSAYVSAKHGLEGFSKVVALEGAEHGVTSNCVNPSYVRTPLVEKQIEDQARAHGISTEDVIEQVMLERVAVKRLVEPEEVAALVAFLCGPTSDSITGASFPIDGGWTAH